jgi:hypothetical protein
MRAPILIAVVSLCSQVAGQELTPKAAAYLKRCEEHTASQMADVRADLQRLKELRDELATILDRRRKATLNRLAGEDAKDAKGRPVYVNSKAKQAAIKEAEKALVDADKNLADNRKLIEARAKEVVSGTLVWPADLPNNYKVGDVGRFGLVMIIEKIIDDQNMIVKASIDRQSAELLQGLGLGREGDTDVRYRGDLAACLRGKSTAGLADGGVLDLENDVLEVTGTTQYTNEAGVTKTVLVLSPFDMGPIERAIKARKR